MIKRNNKKGFTIVELVIVIAVIAILAAVLIPTFSGIVKKANLSADQQAVRQMNTALAMYEAENGKPANLIDAKKALDEALVNVEGGLVPVTQGYAFYWDAANNKVVLVGDSKDVKEGWELLSNNGLGTKVEMSNSNTAGADIKNAIRSSSDAAPVIITLKEDVTCTGQLCANTGKAAVIDLNGKTITFDTTKVSLWAHKGGYLEIKNGTIVLPSTDDTENPSIKNVNSTLILKDVVIERTEGTTPVIYVDGICDTSITDSKIVSKGYAIATNSGLSESDGARIVIENSEIESKDKAAIMVSITTDIKMDNCTVTGTTHAMVLHCATANITNTTFKSTESDSGHTDVGQGANCPAAAVAVMAHGSAQNYGNNGNYTFENCTFDSASAVDVFANSYDANCTLVVTGIGDAAVNAEATRGAGKTTINK